MSKKIREFSKAKEYLMAHSSSEITPIEEIGLIEKKREIKIGMHDGEFWGNPQWLDNSEIKFCTKEIEKINNIIW